jgi:hypothetical protein
VADHFQNPPICGTRTDATKQSGNASGLYQERAFVLGNRS